jgi:hypothetical protein
MNSVTLRCHRKHKVWLHFFAEEAQNDPKTHCYEENAKFHSALLVATLIYATCFRQKLGVIENFEYLGEFGKDFENVGWTEFCIYFSDWNMRKKVKSGYDNLVHVYL